MTRIAIIGGGIVGLSCALAAQEIGRVTLISDARSDQAPSWGNAGHIAIEQVEPLASRAAITGLPARLFSRGGAAAFPLQHLPAWLPFGMRLLAASAPARFEEGRAALTALCGAALPAWRDLVRLIGDTDLLRETGHIIVWESEASAAAGLAAWTSRPVGTAKVERIGADALQAAQRLVTSRLVDGVRFDGSASIADLPRLRGALRSAFRERGGEMTEATVTRLSDIEADHVVVAAGHGSARLMRLAGHSAPLIAECGYHLHCAATDWPAGIAPIVLEDRSLILNRFENGLRASSFVEFGAHAARPDPRKWQRLHRHLAELGIGTDMASQWMGARPTFPDYLPAIGRSRRDPRIVYAFGHQHLGLTLGPLTGRLVAGLIPGEQPPIALEPFSLERFG